MWKSTEKALLTCGPPIGPGRTAAGVGGREPHAPCGRLVGGGSTTVNGPTTASAECRHAGVCRGLSQPASLALPCRLDGGGLRVRMLY